MLHDGTVLSFAPSGTSRYRLRVDRFDRGTVAAWEHGFGVDPLLSVPVSRTAPGPLPRFGALLEVDPPSAVVVGLERAADEDGLIVYLLEIAGAGQLVALTSPILRFGRVRRVDFLGRDLGEIGRPVPGGVLVRVPAHGALALRLSDVELSRG